MPTNTIILARGLLINDLTHEYPDMIEDRIEIPNNPNSVIADILGVYRNIKKD